jgi:hypothetical protein
VTTAQLRNLLVFCCVVLAQVVVISVAAALAADTMPGFREGDFLRPGRETLIGLLALLTPIVAGWVMQNRPRWGSEELAQRVNELRDQGYHRADLTVVPKDGAAPAVSAGDAIIAAAGLDYPILHEGHRALTALVPATGHEVLDASEARHLDGRVIDPGAVVACDRCDARLVSVAAVAGQWVAQGEGKG